MQAVEQSSCYANKYGYLHKCNQMLSLSAYVVLHYVLGSWMLEGSAPALRLQGHTRKWLPNAWTGQGLHRKRWNQKSARISTETCAIETLYHRSYFLLYIVSQIRRKKYYLSVVWKSSDCARIVLLMNNAPCRITALYTGKICKCSTPKTTWHLAVARAAAVCAGGDGRKKFKPLHNWSCCCDE